MNQVFDRWALVLNYQAPLFRLALLLTGNPKQAGRLLERTFDAVSHDSANLEMDLLRALVLLAPESAKRGFESKPNVNITPDQASKLVDLICALPLRERATVGLVYLRGLSQAEVLEVLPTSKRGESLDLNTVREILAKFRASVSAAINQQSIALETLSDLDYLLDGYLSDQAAAELRQVMFSRPDLLQARDQLKCARTLLQQYLPNLYAQPLPNEVHERLYDRFAQLETEPRPTAKTWLARFAIIAAVFVVIAGLILWPNANSSLASESAVDAANRGQTAGELLDRAIRRFEHLPTQGILHEHFDIYSDSSINYEIERWYDMASPHRLRTDVRYIAGPDQSNADVMRFASDGESLVQMHRTWYSGAYGSFDAIVSPQEAQFAIEILQTQPQANLFFNNYSELNDIGVAYLVQARERNASFMGRTLVGGREGYRLMYTTQRLPDDPYDLMDDQNWQVLITIDRETLTVLEISLLYSQDGEFQTKQVLKMLDFAILPELDDQIWTLEESELAVKRQGLPSLRVPQIPPEQFISLEDALQQSNQAIYLPQQVPAGMKGSLVELAGFENFSVLALYEGRYQGLVIVRASLLGYQSASLRDGVHEANGFNYQFISQSDFPGPQTAALVKLADGSNDVLLVLLIDPFSSDSQRQTMISDTIASLTILNSENILQAQQVFLTP